MRAASFTGALLIVAALLTLAAWSLASPPGSSPDDDFHLPSIWCAGGTGETCAEDPAGSPDVRLLPARLVGAPCFHFDGTVSASCQDALPDTMVPDTATSRGNWTGLYPPVFYAVMGLLVNDDLDDSILLIRAVNEMVVVGLVAALAALVPRRLRPVSVVPLLITSVPLGLSIFSSTNPSSWAIVSAAVVWPALYAAFERDGPRRWALLGLTLVAVVLGSGSRGDACLFSAMGICLALGLRFGQLRHHPAALATGLGALAISAYFLLNAGQSGLVATGLPEESLGIPWYDLAVLNLQQLPVLWFGGFGYGALGSGGWFDTSFPALLVLALCVWAAVVFGGLREMDRLKLAALTVVGLALTTYPLVVLGRTGVTVGTAFQPRYLMPVLVIFTGIALLPTARGQRLSKLQVLVLAAGLSVAQSLALATQIRRYVTGQDVTGFALDRGKEWWWDLPVSAMFVWVVGSIAFLVLSLLAFQGYAAGQTPGTRDDDRGPLATAS